jgi:undecaprenyl-diphosphatase
LVIGTIPGAIVGALFEQQNQDQLGAPWLIAMMLVVFGIVLVVVDRISRSDRAFDSIGPKTGLVLGTAQALALQPGVSRSGVTMTAARAMGLDRESAARFSFLLSLPLSGFVVIWGLLRYLKRHDFTVFLWYRIGVAAVVTILILSDTRPATI